MTVKALKAAAMVDDDRVSENIEPASEKHLAVIGRNHRRVGHNRQVKTQVDFVIDDLPVISVGAEISEGRFYFGVSKLDERLAPQEFRIGLPGKLKEALLVDQPQIAIDFDVIFEEPSLVLNVGCLAQNGWHDALHEGIRDLQSAGMKFLGKHLVIKIGKSLVPGVILRDDPRRCIGVHIVGESENAQTPLRFGFRDWPAWEIVFPYLNARADGAG